MNRFEAQRAILAKVQECIGIARNLYPGYVQDAPTVKFKLTGRSTGGTALGTRELDFNLDWYAADPARFLSIIVPHEVAHIVDTALHPELKTVAYNPFSMRRPRRVSHGPTWVRICLALGGDGRRTCNISLESGVAVAKRRRTRQFRYLSERGGEVWVGPSHHKKLQERGDIMVAGRHLYYLTHKLHGRVYKSGFTNQCRMA